MKVDKANRNYWETGTTPKNQEPDGLTLKPVFDTCLDRLETKVGDGDRSTLRYAVCGKFFAFVRRTSQTGRKITFE